MKRFVKNFVCLFLLVCVLLPLPARGVEKQEVLSFIKSHEYTADATCVTFGKYCVVGVRTKGILLKSDCQKYFDDITQGVMKLDDNLQHVYVTNDLQEVLVIKDVCKKKDEGMGNMQIFQYVKQKYPKAIDKILLRANI